MTTPEWRSPRQYLSGFGNELAAAPQFYNTVTANCASTVYHLVQVIKPDMPLDYRLLFSGQLPEYIDELGGLPGDMPMDQRRKLARVHVRLANQHLARASGRSA